ncbi:hypothetical protein ACQKP0_24695 [Heyndrickxia sp. NPDC080065]|uniref:hypothetical protein n=1 Tax=Heyndrickxia sp. NPDC080065 TaxID=3390568 RepID=UPI003D07AB83
MNKNSAQERLSEPIGLNGMKENPDGTVTGFFFRADGGPHATKEYPSEEEYRANMIKDRKELLGNNA